MMTFRRRVFWALTLMFFIWHQAALARGLADDPPPGPDRVRLVEKAFTRYAWWLARWADDEVVCEVVVLHSGQPTDAEIYEQCGAQVYQTWQETTSCATENAAGCPGYYLFLVRQETVSLPVASPLPPARIWLTTGHCLPQGFGVWCPQAPTLTLVGEEPLDGYAIVEVAGQLDETPFSCRQATCVLPLPATAGAYHLRVWGLSSYGDSTPVQEMQIQVTPLEVGWQLSLVSDEQQAWPQPFCAEYWNAFPPLPEDLPAWLTPNPTTADLQTSGPYAYLAGQLLQRGALAVETCPQGAVDENGWATDCGLRAIWPLVVSWQNQFDEVLIATETQYQVPAVLLKNLFAYESQLWPGEGLPNHAGLGQLTPNGADLALMWNPRLYEQFCAQIYAPEVCRDGYWRLKDDERLYLQESFYAQVNVVCPSCPYDVDLARAEASIPLFAETLRASCAQTGALVRNVTGRAAGDVFSYVDLWKLTLANYHAGSGCLGAGLRTARARGALSWEGVAAAFPDGCRSAVTYVEALTGSP